MTSNNVVTNNSENSNNTDSDDTKRNRRNKKLFYDKERNELINNLNNFINIDNNDGIYLIDLYQNKDLIQFLKNNIDNIKKCYRCSSWGYFVSENNDQQGDEITLLKAIYKDHGFDIFRKDVTAVINGIKKRYTKLFFQLKK
jgi:hypothetical protein